MSTRPALDEDFGFNTQNSEKKGTQDGEALTILYFLQNKGFNISLLNLSFLLDEYLTNY